MRLAPVQVVTVLTPSAVQTDDDPPSTPLTVGVARKGMLI